MIPIRVKVKGKKVQRIGVYNRSNYYGKELECNEDHKF